MIFNNLTTADITVIKNITKGWTTYEEFIGLPGELLECGFVAELANVVFNAINQVNDDQSTELNADNVIEMAQGLITDILAW